MSSFSSLLLWSLWLLNRKIPGHSSLKIQFIGNKSLDHESTPLLSPDIWTRNNSWKQLTYILLKIRFLGKEQSQDDSALLTSAETSKLGYLKLLNTPNSVDTIQLFKNLSIVSRCPFSSFSDRFFRDFMNWIHKPWLIAHFVTVSSLESRDAWITLVHQ